MKFFALFFVVTSAIVLWAGVDALLLRHIDGTDMEPMLKACMEDHNVSYIEVLLARNGGTLNARRHVKCFLNCLGSKAGILVNGAMDEAKTKEILSRDFAPAAVERSISICRPIAEPDLCEYAAKTLACYQKSGTAIL